MKKALNIIITSISIICAIITVVLILFADTIFQVDSSGNVIITTTESVNISFDTDPLIIDGTDLSLLQGVTAIDENGKDVTNMVSASVVNDNEQKLILYGINDPNYDLESFERGLQLKNYEGPSISIKNKNYTCDINDLETYITDMIAEGNIKAKDGYGNDISKNVYIDPSTQITESGKQHISLVVKNTFVDMEKKDIEIDITGKVEKNRVILSSESITVRKGNNFSPRKYIATAENGDGEDISDMIVFDNQTDVNVPGSYSVYYYVAGEENEEPVATLSVVVIE